MKLLKAEQGLMYFFKIFFREIREYKSRVESYSREMLRKEAQCRDLQQRLENGEGSKLYFIYFLVYEDHHIFFGEPSRTWL